MPKIKQQSISDELRMLMSETHIPVRQIVEDTGISERWWYAFLRGDLDDTKTKRAEMLIRYLKTGKK